MQTKPICTERRTRLSSTPEECQLARTADIFQVTLAVHLGKIVAESESLTRN
jgi:hypothetical protein